MGFSAKYDVIVCVAFFAWIIVALLFVSAGLREGGLICQATPTGRVCRAHPYARIFAAMLGLLFTVGALLMIGPEMLGLGQRHAPTQSSDWFLFAIFVGICAAVGLPMFWLSGPNEFLIDLDRRTYRHTYGLLFPQVRAGAMDDDLAGVYARCVSMNSRYDVGLVWKQGRKWQRLAAFNRSGRADRVAEETAAALGLPLVAPPPCLKSASDTRGGLG